MPSAPRSLLRRTSPTRANASASSSRRALALGQGARRQRRGRRGLRRASACRSRCARARSRTSSATATSRSASPSTSASAAATPARSDFSPAAIEQTVRAAYDIARFTAEDPAAGLPDADDLATGEAATRDLDLFHPWAIDAEAAIELALALRGGGARGRPRASPTPKAPASRRSSRTSTPATRAASAAATRARATRSRSRRSPRCPARAATTCSATPGTPRCARPTSWPRPRPSAATPPSARCPACGSRKIGTREVPVLFESSLAVGPARRLRAGDQRRRALPQVVLPARLPRQARPRRPHRRARGPARAARQGQRPVRRRGRAHDAARRRRRRRRRRATSCRPTRRASWA